MSHSRFPPLPRSRLPALLIAVAALIAFAALLADADLAALQRLAVGEENPETEFAKLKDFLFGLRDSLLPLAVPLGGIGLVAGGVLYMVGNPMAQRILVGVGIGLGVVLGAPSIVA